MSNTTSQKSEQSAWDLHLQAAAPQFACPEVSLGPWTSYSLMHDPKHMAFVLARYKFCAKMLEGKDFVVEIGCGDGFGLPLIAQAVKHVHCIDWDERSLEGCSRRLKHLKNVTYQHIDLNKEHLPIKADAIYTIDVIEHLEPSKEDAFFRNLCKSLKPEGILITGTPNVTSNPYASEQSRSQHINLKSLSELKQLTLKYFIHAFPFGMNDEILHTGYGPMSHYIWTIGAQVRSQYQ